MRRRHAFLPLCLLGCLLSSCSTLPLQKELGRYVAGAREACEKASDRCAAALRCGEAARDGIAALQEARGAELTRASTTEAVRAIALPPAALTQCKVLGIKPAAPAPAAPALKAVP